MKRSLLEISDGHTIMIGDVQVNEEVEGVWPEVSSQQVEGWHQRVRAGKVKWLQSQNDFMSMHDVPSSEVVNKETNHQNTLGLQRTRSKR